MKMTNWIKVEEKLPEQNQICLVWAGSNMYICKYAKVLTWKGFKLKFVNLLSKRFWLENVTHWMQIPEGPKL